MNTARPIDVATAHTLEFLEIALAQTGTLIEVGCGAGHLAAALGEAGHRVIGIDAEAGNVAATRARGVTAFVARWPECAGTPADAVAFTRSLHHIAPLRRAIAQARAMLKDGGALVVEDFAHDRADSRDVAWLREQLLAGRTRGLLPADAGGFAGTLIAASDPMEAWRNHVEDHGVHASDAMRAAIVDEFGRVAESNAPYLYRYAIPWLPETREATAWIEAVGDEERRRIGRGDLHAIWLRFVASRVAGARGIGALVRRATPSPAAR